jgi:hypothetical protein
MKTISEQEFLDLYGDTEMQFSSYYKYSFTYKGVAADGMEILARVGGSSDDIYRYEVLVTDRFPLCMLDARYFEARDTDGYIKLDAYSV